MRIFLDANVIFAACWSPEGRAALLVSIGRAGKVQLVTSPHALEETRRNLQVKRPDALDELARVRQVVQLGGEGSHAQVAWAAELGLPAGDAPILAAVVALKADMLATGDARHFGRLYGVRCDGVLVVPIRDALARVLET